MNFREKSAIHLQINLSRCALTFLVFLIHGYVYPFYIELNYILDYENNIFHSYFVIFRYRSITVDKPSVIIYVPTGTCSIIKLLRKARALSYSGIFYAPRLSSHGLTLFSIDWISHGKI